MTHLVPTLLLLMTACGDEADGDTAAPGGDTAGAGAAPATGAGVVSFETSDGVTLAADWRPAAHGDRPAVLLLHMIPPTYDRSSWPQAFVDTLAAHDWSVLVLDRRGAGDSGGTARDAYEGPGGRLDVEAAVAFLAAEGATSLAIVGASNGTTSLTDFVVGTGDAAPLVPAALVYMTGGDYTENQHDLADVAAVGTPAAFTFSTAERAWSVAQQDLDPGGWRFFEYAEGDHGTRMFAAAPAVAADIDGFLDTHLD
jgi:pimeloyl-ACP methyl ester carboxylesterase